jgi:hypothetical protein
MGAPKVRWTVEEEDALRKGVKDYGTGRWKNIKQDPKYKVVLDKRSNVDLKDKWRNILVAEGQIEKPSARKGRKRKQQLAEEEAARAGIQGTLGSTEQALDTNKTRDEIDQQAQEVLTQAVTQAKDNKHNGTGAAQQTTGSEPKKPKKRGTKSSSKPSLPDHEPIPEFSSLPMEEKVIAAIIALKDGKATAPAIQQSMQKIGDENKKSDTNATSSGEYTLKDVNAKLKKMCNSGTLAKDKNGTYKILGLGGGDDGKLPSKKNSQKLSQISSKKSDDYKDLSTSEATVVAARAVAEALAAARTAQEAMAEAVELEQLVSVKKQQDQEKQNEEGGAREDEDALVRRGLGLEQEGEDKQSYPNVPPKKR